MIGLNNPISETNPNTTQDNFYTNLVKNRISESEKQLAEKHALTDFLSVQIISKRDLQKNKRSDNGQVNKKSDYDVLPLKKSSDDITKNVLIIGGSMLKGCVRYIFASLFLSLNESTCETGKNASYFTSKALFDLEKIKF